MIYFFKDTGTGHHKIGFTSSKSAKDRLGGCQTGNPNKLVITGVIPGTKKKEKELHSKYSSYNIINEWFSLTEKQVIDIILEHGGEVHAEGYEEQRKWRERIEMIKDRFSSLSSLVYRGDDTIPLLSDEQIEQLDAQVSRVRNAIKDGMKDNEELIKFTCVERKTGYYYTDKDEKKTHAIFQVTPTVKINFMLEKLTEEYVEDQVNKRFVNRFKKYEEAMTSVVEDCKKDANKSIVNLLESTEKELEERNKEIEELKNKLKELEAVDVKEEKQKVKEAMLKALEAM